jgi:endonuclease-3
VDTHVARTSNRLGWTTQTVPEKVEADLLKIIPEKYQNKVGHWLVLHGRYICKAKKPDCENCPISKYCPSFGKF